MSVSWRYDGDSAFFSECCSTVQRLPNGNLLTVVTEKGIVFELTPDGERVWEFWSPYRVRGKPDIVANLFDVVRLPPADQLPWLSPKRP
jgi:hypothetical protein